MQITAATGSVEWDNLQICGKYRAANSIPDIKKTYRRQVYTASIYDNCGSQFTTQIVMQALSLLKACMRK
jgi:hypothetical protein